MSVSYGGDKITFDDGSSTSSGWTGFKNRFINGEIRFDQRNNGANTAVTTGGQYIVDRWFNSVSANSRLFSGRNLDGVTPPSNFSHCLGFKTVATYTFNSNEQSYVQQVIEGNNVTDFAWGTSSAAPATLSFWVRASIAGTYGGVIQNDNGERNWPFSYTINNVNTWEYKTVTITGETTGVNWYRDNRECIRVQFSLGCHSGRKSAPNAWTTTYSGGVPGQVDLMTNLGATWYITGLQFEKGTSASSFEYRPHGTELQLCQRYYELIGFGNIAMAESGSTYVMNLNYKVTKRTQPSIGLYTTSNIRVRQFGIGDRDAASPSAGATAGSTNGGYIKVSGFNAIGSSSTPAGIGFTTSSENGDLFFINSEI